MSENQRLTKQPTDYGMNQKLSKNSFTSSLDMKKKIFNINSKSIKRSIKKTI